MRGFDRGWIHAELNCIIYELILTFKLYTQHVKHSSELKKYTFLEMLVPNTFKKFYKKYWTYLSLKKTSIWLSENWETKKC